ncbi:MAG: hypothetical protein ACOYOB_19005 [Myxococcota bacterium]
MARRPRRTHLDAGPHLHPMTLLDLFYFIVDNHYDLIEAWDRSKHEVWCTCGNTPQAYAHPTMQRPVLLQLSARDLRCVDHERAAKASRTAAPRQLELDLGSNDIDF